ncbi:MAG: Esterase/lipase [Chloroflexi bacterium]|nr:MAG: Esterase/lipase [Chloroflexota bacterium]
MTLLLSLMLLVAACGGDDGGDAASGDGTGDRSGERRPDATVFTWQSSDGVEIEAEVRRGGDQWVLMGHQFTGNRRDWDQMVEGFSARGYTVLTWDFRCHGESGCNTVNNSKRDATKEIWREWLAALDYAKANGATVIHAGGASMGGTSLIQVAADRDDITTIFAISSPNRFQGLDALENYDRVTVPKLFIVGADDMAAPDFSQRYFDMATGPARLDILETALHGNTLAQDPVWGPIVQPMLYAFAEDPDGYIAAGEVNNLESAAQAEAADEESDAVEAEQAEDEQPVASEDGNRPAGAPLSGYALALIAPGDGGDQVVIVDPFQSDEFVITRQFEGDVEEVIWLPSSPTVGVGTGGGGTGGALILLDLTTEPPGEVRIPFDFLPDGIAPQFFDMQFSNDGIVLSFSVVPEGVAQAPATPAVVNLLGPTLLAPYAGVLSDSPTTTGLQSPDDTLLLSREVGEVLLLLPTTLAPGFVFAAPEIDEPPTVCVGGECVPLEYSTIFPDEYDWFANSSNNAFWVRYTNKLYIGSPEQEALVEWLTLPGVPFDASVSPGGDQIAWVTSGPPEGANGIFISDIQSEATRLLVQDSDLIFFDLQWSPDSRFISFSSLSRVDRSVGVLVIDAATGEVFTIGPGCCAEWSPFISAS